MNKISIKVAALSCVAAMAFCTVGVGCTDKTSEDSSSDSSVATGTAELDIATSTTELEDSAMADIKAAVDGLKKYSDPYLVSVGITMPSESTYYIEVNDKNGSYTQYSTDDEGNLGKTSYENADNTNFMLFDWVTPDDKGYLVNQSYTEGENKQWLSLPSDYAHKLQSRKILYMDTLMEGLHDVEKGDTTTADLGNGDKELQLYMGTIDSDVIASVIGVDTLGLYGSLKDEAENNKDDNVISLMDKYLEELDMNLTFSDAKATFGVCDDVIRYLQLEIGGLGSRMVYTKTVLDTTDAVLYDTPDFSSCESYYLSVKELADYVAKYGSYEEAMEDLYGETNGITPEVDGVVEDSIAENSVEATEAAETN